jgi:hypothetical protein
MMIFYEDLLDDVAFEYLNTLVEFLKKAHKDTWFYTCQITKWKIIKD